MVLLVGVGGYYDLSCELHLNKASDAAILPTVPNAGRHLAVCHVGNYRRTIQRRLPPTSDQTPRAVLQYCIQPRAIVRDEVVESARW